jgi:nicotinamide mononucleotide adenylyltransferase
VPYLVESEPDISGIKEKAKETIKTFESQLQNDKAKFKKTAPNLDADSVRKTEEFFVRLEKKIAALKKATNANLSGKTYYINLLNSVLGYRVDRIINFEAGVGRDPKDDFRKRVIIWSGRAQPWHLGHHAMVEKGKKALADSGADAVYIMLVKGAATSKDKATNPLSEKEQYELLSSIYEGDPEVIVADKFSKSGFIVDIMEDLHDKGHKVVGWLAGADRFGKYMKALRTFSPSKYLEDHDYSPIDKDENGDVLVKMIETPRLMSGTQARESALTLGFDEWYNNIAPQGLSVNLKHKYKAVYDKIREAQDEPAEIEEISSMAGGNVEGAPAAQGGPWEGDDIGKENEEEKKRSKLNMKGSLVQEEKLINEVMDYLLNETRSSI